MEIWLTKKSLQENINLCEVRAILAFLFFRFRKA